MFPYPVKPNGPVPAPAEPHQRKAPSYRKSMWSQTEDQMLFAAVNKYGTNNWGIVASEVHGRTGKQCRERWAGILNPSLARFSKSCTISTGTSGPSFQFTSKADRR